MTDQDKKIKENDKKYPGYPSSPKEEDVFNADKVVPLDDEEENTDLDMDLDIPGADADDADEAIGNEDEENNYYSLPD